MEENKKDKFTPEQRQAIDVQGKAIVSASAGSGKTTVMIEKIINIIRDGGKVSEILAVTFTKKAASQMKEKLRKALVAAINEPNIDSARRQALKEQIDEVATADISTIHSFCSRLIRTHFYKADVDNSFRVIASDDADGVALKGEALDDLFDEGYAGDDEDFEHLISVYWHKKSDKNLRKNVLDVYDELRNRADYRAFLKNMNGYDEPLFDNVCADLMGLLKDKAEYYLKMVDEERKYFTPMAAKQQLLLCDDISAYLNDIIFSPDYIAACGLAKPTFTRKSTSKNDSEEKKEHIERLANIKEKVVKIYESLEKTGDRQTELEAFITSGKTARAIAKFLLKFDDKYSLLKQEKGVLDYGDLEHKALALLDNEEVVKQLRDKYRYVFVDEYQDVNPVQEELISKVAGENLFLVGDVKQSIYGFRGSKSQFFIDKQEKFKQGEGKNLFMSSNFRSSDAVLDAVNEQFSKAMTLYTSNVDYANDSYMHKGGRYALNSGRVQLHLLKEADDDQEDGRGVYSVKEHAYARAEGNSTIAKTIRHIIDWERTQKWFDADNQQDVPVRYSDIAILARKKKGSISKTVASLAAEGIPVTAASAVNICEFGEIKALMDILSLIDNARQDVPLCSALCSIANLSPNDLATIRLAYKKENFFRNACLKYSEEKKDELSHRLKRFYAYLEDLRRLSCVVSAGELLTKILTDTRMEAHLLTRENGESCMKRISRFIEETNVEEPLSVHDFLARLRDLDYEIEYSENGGEDSVKVLTMHSSKGLEYPVVITDDLSAAFRGADHDEFLVEEKYGIAPRAFNEEKMTKRATLLRRLCETKQKLSSTMDELNLYYVALTRAKYGLHLLFTKKKEMQKLSNATFLKQMVQDVRYASSFADFTDFSVWEKYLVEDKIFDVPKADRQAYPSFNPNEMLAKSIMHAFTWQYTHQGMENLPVKSSATQLMDSAPIVVEETFDDRNESLTEGAGQTSIEAGLAYHAFLEQFDFSLLYDERGNAITKDTLLDVVHTSWETQKNNGTLVGEELLSKDKLVEILLNPVFYNLQGMRLYKERQFLVALPINATYAKKTGADERLKELGDDEEMIFQGAIDLLAVDGDRAWIIDYKYSVKDEKALKEHYKPQLQLYKMATAKILGIPQENIKCSIVNIFKGFQTDFE